MKNKRSNRLKKHAKLPCKCAHTSESKGPLALVAVGNVLRRDDGVAQELCKLVPAYLSAQLCCFDLGPYTSLLKDCVACHQSAIVLDSMESGRAPGSFEIIDLKASMDAGALTTFGATHGFSLVDELYIASKTCTLPEHITLFAVEAEDAGWGEGLSLTLQNSLPQLIHPLLSHIRERL